MLYMNTFINVPPQFVVPNWPVIYVIKLLNLLRSNYIKIIKLIYLYYIKSAEKSESVFKLYLCIVLIM